MEQRPRHSDKTPQTRMFQRLEWLLCHYRQALWLVLAREKLKNFQYFQYREALWLVLAREKLENSLNFLKETRRRGESKSFRATAKSIRGINTESMFDEHTHLAAAIFERTGHIFTTIMITAKLSFNRNRTEQGEWQKQFHFVFFECLVTKSAMLFSNVFPSFFYEECRS
jgi:hypothetical protein